MWCSKETCWYYSQGCCQRTPRQSPRSRETQLHPTSARSPLGGGHHLRQKLGGLALPLVCVGHLLSRKVVGWSMANHLRAELVLDALNMALYNRLSCSPGLIHHSDRGSQYTSLEFGKRLKEAEVFYLQW